MYKIKKVILNILTLLYLIFSLAEFIVYFSIDNTLFGLIYLLNNLFIIFLFIPTTFNYKKYYSPLRISKLIIIILFGIFNSYILQYLFLNGVHYVDDSIIYSDKIFLFKNVFKGIIYFLLFLFTIFEFKLEKLLKKANNHID